MVSHSLPPRLTLPDEVLLGLGQNDELWRTPCVHTCGPFSRLGTSSQDEASLPGATAAFQATCPDSFIHPTAALNSVKTLPQFPASSARKLSTSRSNALYPCQGFQPRGGRYLSRSCAGRRLRLTGHRVLVRLAGKQLHVAPLLLPRPRGQQSHKRLLQRGQPIQCVFHVRQRLEPRHAFRASAQLTRCLRTAQQQHAQAARIPAA